MASDLEEVFTTLFEHCWNYLKGNSRRPWILDADLKSAFDQISHEHILKAIGSLPGRELIRAWLKAGYVEADFFHTTDSGVIRTPDWLLLHTCRG
jgi:RNA-directed DNA polymerase